MSRLAAAFILLLSTLSARAQAPCPAPTNSGAVASSQWAYDITLTDPQKQLLRVRMTIAPTSPHLKVQLPVWNALYQVRDFAQHVNWLRATDANGKRVEVRQLDKTTWFTPSATTIDYEIAAIDLGPFGAEFNAHHAFLNLAQVLVYPVGISKQLVKVQVSGVPETWHIATPMNHDGDAYCAASYDQMVDSPMEIGSFRDVKFDSDAATFDVIIDADPNDYDTNAIKKTLRRIVDAEIDWMQDRPFQHYMFIYHFPSQFGGGGMEHAYGAAIETSAARLKQDPLAFAGVSAHEFFHLWNVKRIRPQSLEPIDYTKENYTRALWFSEGFTSAVAEYMLVRAGLDDERTFLTRLASQIKDLETRPARLTQSAEESSLGAWLEKYPYYRSPARSVSYYDKGQIVGVLLDLEMRHVTNGRKSLRDLFQWMNKHYARNDKYFDDTEGIRNAVEVVTGANFEEFFTKYVSGTNEIPYNDFFETVGVRLERTTTISSDAGFAAATNFGPNPIVISVTPNGESEKAGLRPGDVILKVNGREPQPDVVAQIAGMEVGSAVKLKISSDGGTREIKYKLPMKQDLEYFFSEMPNASLAERMRRAAWVRGDSQSNEAGN